jgi:hypothetical protein
MSTKEYSNRRTRPTAHPRFTSGGEPGEREATIWVLPKKNGSEVLAEIKGDPALRVIPVVVLSTSQAEVDVLKAYGLHANCYVTKPVEIGGFAAVIRSIEKFWFTVVTLPDETP